MHICRPAGDKTSRVPITLVIPPNLANPTCCPVRAVQDLMLVRKHAPTAVILENRILFSYTKQNNTQSSKDYMRKRLQKILGRHITGHSFRRGRISHMVSLNMSETYIKHISRHTLTSTNFSKYIDKSSLDFSQDIRVPSSIK